MLSAGKPQADIESVALKNDHVSLYVLSHHEIYTDGLINLLSQNTHYHVTCCLDDVVDLMHFKVSNPDVLLVHQSIVEPMLVTGTSIDLLFADYKNISPDIRIMIFGNHVDESDMRKMIRSGVRGFIDSSMTQYDLTMSIREVSLGGYWINRQVMGELIHNAIEIEQVMEQEVKNRIEDLQYKLTRREADVFHLVMEGMPTKQIASTMHLSEQGVKLHLGRLFKKFKVSNRTQLILMTFTRMCPVNNLIQLIRKSVDKRRMEKGYSPLIADPLKGI
ncbi:MAG: hypothetical protein DIZ80_03850 [endosymbiont of Galathealinum brachiosum]|uniref:HTH luxR-type domain-containing protein n=1 Tax=endosymbiont of Galathealinum brachiosum TaxID=2200906 RepID=A0A370DI70_9GAMM|nr:MAG: hypothetical protein DIZ80_03850 [endosymbiont of Galathealinum brachiosum]